MIPWQAALQTLADLSERNAHLHGEDLHLIFGERRATFRSFTERSLRLEIIIVVLIAFEILFTMFQIFVLHRPA